MGFIDTLTEWMDHQSGLTFLGMNPRTESYITGQGVVSKLGDYLDNPNIPIVGSLFGDVLHGAARPGDAVRNPGGTLSGMGTGAGTGFAMGGPWGALIGGVSGAMAGSQNKPGPAALKGGQLGLMGGGGYSAFSGGAGPIFGGGAESAPSGASSYLSDPGMESGVDLSGVGSGPWSEQGMTFEGSSSLLDNPWTQADINAGSAGSQHVSNSSGIGGWLQKGGNLMNLASRGAGGQGGVEPPKEEPRPQMQIPNVGQGVPSSGLRPTVGTPGLGGSYAPGQGDILGNLRREIENKIVQNRVLAQRMQKET